MHSSGAEYRRLITPIMNHCKLEVSMKPMYSTVTGRAITKTTELDAGYWQSNLESTVEFYDALQSMVTDQTKSFLIEIGPHSTLSGPIRNSMQSLNNQNYVYAPTLVRGVDTIVNILQVAGQAFLEGISIDTSSINGMGPVVTNLPPYPWHRQTVKIWNENRLTHDWRFRQFRHHELLGSRCVDAGSRLEPCWRNILRPRQTQWLWQHRIEKNVVFPCAGYIAMIVEATRQATGLNHCTLRFLFIKQSLILQESADVEIFTTLKPAVLTRSTDSTWYEFSISSYQASKKDWVKHCTGQVQGISEGRTSSKNLDKILPCSRHVSNETWYKKLKLHGLNYGPHFRGLKGITTSPTSHVAVASIENDPTLQDSTYTMHPVLIDQCLQLLSVAACRGLSWLIERIGVPLSIDEVVIFSSGKASMIVEGTTTNPLVSDLCGSARVMAKDDDDSLLLQLNGVRFASVYMGSATGDGLLASHVHWKPDLLSLPRNEVLQTSANPDINIIATIALLETMEVAEMVRDRTSELQYLLKYKNWVQEETKYIIEGKYDFIPGFKECATAGNDRRREISLQLSQELGTPTARRIFKDLWPGFKTQIPELFDGHKSSLELMHDSEGGGDIYGFSVMSWPQGPFFSLLTHYNPQMRILEIGAGTGAATEAILRAFTTSDGVQLFSSYTVTDISPGFLARLRDRCASFMNNTWRLEYTVLDISKDPCLQGFDPNSYDLIIASNVLHATPVLQNSLRNVKSLLAPGGFVFIHELCSSKCIQIRLSS